MKRVVVLLCLVCLAGCSTDSALSLSRDYRNLNNEAIDALMMVTNESRAQVARNKILGKVYGDRLQAIDKRFENWIQNTDDKLVMVDTMTSESVVTLLAELPINRRRLDHEMQRLGALVAAKAKEGIDVRKEMPALSDLANGTSSGGLKTQLDSSNKFANILVLFNDDKNKRWAGQRPKDFDELGKALEERRNALKMAR